MGPLQNNIAQSRYRDANGTLVDTSQEEYQTLAGKAGLQAQPTSPIVAQQIGANPNQVKMAASPQVQQSALQLSQMPPSQGLATATRQAQARTQQTSAEQAQQQKAGQMAGLGDTGSRVQDAISAAINNITSTTPTTAPAVDTTSTLYQSVAPDKQAQLGTDLTALSSNPNDQNALMAVNTDLGRNANSQLTPAELSQLYKSNSTTISGDVANATPAAITVGQLAQQPGFGYSINDLGSMLGVPSSDLSNYTPAQLSNAVSAEQQKEFSRTAALDQAGTSANLGTAERAEARQLGQEASATGQRATEADVARIQQSVANGDQVQFNGQSYTAEDLLGNSEISKTVAAYLAAPEGSATRQQLDQTEPQLSNYIKQHQAVLTQASQALQQNTTNLATQVGNNQNAATYAGQTLAPDVMSALMPGYDSTKIQGPVDTSKSPALSYISSLPPDQQAQAVPAINGLSAAQKQELATMTPDEISKLQLGLGNNSPVLKALTQANAVQTQLQGIDPHNADAVYSAFTGQPGTTAPQLQAQVDALYKAAALGLTNYGTAGGLDMNRDGKLDDPTQVYANMQKQTSNATLANAENGTGKQFSLATFSPYDDTNQTQIQASLASKLTPYAAGGSINTAALKSSGILGNESEVRELANSGMTKNMDPATRAAVQQAVQSFTTKNTQSVISKYPLPNTNKATLPTDVGGLEGLSRKIRDQYQALTNEAQGYGDKVDIATVQQRVAALRDKMNNLDTMIAQKKQQDIDQSDIDKKTLEADASREAATRKALAEKALKESQIDPRTYSYNPEMS